jgi:hypothetical protein
MVGHGAPRRLAIPSESSPITPSAIATCAAAGERGVSRRAALGTKKRVPVTGVEKSRIRSWLPGNPVLTFQVYEQVATRRYLDEEEVWNVMRFADEPEQRAPSQLTRTVNGPLNGPLAGKSTWDELPGNSTAKTAE